LTDAEIKTLLARVGDKVYERRDLHSALSQVLVLSELRKGEVQEKFLALILEGKWGILDYAQFIAAYSFDFIRAYILREIETLGIVVSREEEVNSFRKAYEALTLYYQKHLESVNEELPLHLHRYVAAITLFLRGVDMFRISTMTDQPYHRVMDWAKRFDWKGFKRNTLNPITEIIEEAFEIGRRLDQVRVAPFTGAYVDIEGRNLLRMLKSGEINQVAPERRIRLWTDIATLQAKLTGESIDRSQLDIGFSQLYKQIGQIDPKVLINVKPQEKLLE
jgi:hypothetical protein